MEVSHLPTGPNLKAIGKQVASGQLLVVDTATGEPVLEARDTIAGLIATVEKQARTIGSLERRITTEEDPGSHPKGAEIVALIERWKLGSGHGKSKVSADRVKIVKAALKDDYTVEQLELAVDGICAFPYVGTGGQRFARGESHQRHDRLGIALGGGEAVERFANLGAEARRRGWTPEGGWS